MSQWFTDLTQWLGTIPLVWCFLVGQNLVLIFIVIRHRTFSRHLNDMIKRYRNRVEVLEDSREYAIDQLIDAQTEIKALRSELAGYQDDDVEDQLHASFGICDDVDCGMHRAS